MDFKQAETAAEEMLDDKAQTSGDPKSSCTGKLTSEEKILVVKLLLYMRSLRKAGHDPKNITKAEKIANLLLGCRNQLSKNSSAVHDLLKAVDAVWDFDRDIRFL